MKIHLFASSMPLDEGTDLTAACSSLVKSCHWVFQGPEKIETWPNICTHCRENFVPIKGYLYGGISGPDWDKLRAKRGDNETEV